MVDQVKETPPQRPSLSEMAEKRREEIVQRVKEGVQEAGIPVPSIIRNPVIDISDPNFYFQSHKDNFSFIYKVTRKQIKFNGCYFQTNDKKVAAYIRKCYGNDVIEIDKEGYEEGTTLKPGAAEAVKSSIVVTKLPGY